MCTSEENTKTDRSSVTVEKSENGWTMINSEIDITDFGKTHSDQFFRCSSNVLSSMGKRGFMNLPSHPFFSKYKECPVRRMISSKGKYEGQVKGGVRHGAGHYQNMHGDLYVCFFESDVSNGPAAIYFTNGDYFKGELKNGMMNDGQLFFANGEVYEGGFNEYGYHGHGKYIFPDGKKFEGMYKDNVKSGYGVFQWPNGSKYEGLWDVVQNGKGKFTSEDGKVVEGIFEDGKKIIQEFDGK